MYICAFILGSSARFARTLVGPSGPLWARLFWAPLGPLSAGPLCAPLGPWQCHVGAAHQSAGKGPGGSTRAHGGAEGDRFLKPQAPGPVAFMITIDRKRTTSSHMYIYACIYACKGKTVYMSWCEVGSKLCAFP